MSNRIKALRQQEGLKQKDLATLLNVTQATLSSWECGRYEPDQKALKILSKRFDVSIDYLLGVSDSVSVGDIFSKEEAELLRIYRNLDVRGRAKLLNAAFALEDENK